MRVVRPTVLARMVLVSSNGWLRTTRRKDKRHYVTLAGKDVSGNVPRSKFRGFFLCYAKY